MVIIGVWLFVFGGVVGSFVCALVDRTPPSVKQKNFFKIFFSRSKCDACDRALGTRDLVPVFSYLYQRGRCRYCKSKLGMELLLMEVISAGMTIAILMKGGISNPSALLALILGYILLHGAYFEYKYRQAPKFLSLVFFILCGILVLIKLATNTQNIYLSTSLTNLMIGTLLMVGVAILSRGKTGITLAELLIFASYGFGFGLTKLMLLLITTFMIGGIAGVIVFTQKKTVEHRLPLLPIILTSYILVTLFSTNIYHILFL